MQGGSHQSSTASAGNAGAEGLTSEEARHRLNKFGPNAVPDTSVHPLQMILEKFWAPVPWMLEASVLLELASANMSRPRSSSSCWCSTLRWDWSRRAVPRPRLPR